MIGWLDFFILFYWLCLGLFFFNNTTVVSLLIYAELTWLILFVLATIVGAHANDLTSMSITFFILGFGGLEFVVGLLLVILLKNFNISLTTNAKLPEAMANTNSSGNLNTRAWNL